MALALADPGAGPSPSPKRAHEIAVRLAALRGIDRILGIVDDAGEIEPGIAVRGDRSCQQMPARRPSVPCVPRRSAPSSSPVSGPYRRWTLSHAPRAGVRDARGSVDCEHAGRSEPAPNLSARASRAWRTVAACAASRAPAGRRAPCPTPRRRRSSARAAAPPRGSRGGARRSSRLRCAGRSMTRVPSRLLCTRELLTLRRPRSSSRS